MKRKDILLSSMGSEAYTTLKDLSAGNNVGKRFDEKYTVVTMKYPPRQMIWGVMSCFGTAGLYFIPSNTTFNGPRYMELLKKKLKLHMDIHKCTIFMQD